MRRHDDRPGDAGGYPDERHGSGASYGAGAQDPAGNQGLGVQRHNYYYDDDPGYSDSAATSVVEAPSRRSDDFYDDLGGTGKQFGWSASTDLGLLVLRLALGALFGAHGAQKLGILPGPMSGPENFASALSQMGFEQTATLALVTGATELGSGALLVLGLFTPLAAAGILGVIGSALAMHVTGPFFLAEGGYEFEFILAAAALGLMFTGPGRVALDNGRVWFRRPLGTGLICLVISAGAATAVLLLFR